LTDPNPQFATTQWTLVWNAAAERNAEAGRPAIEELMRRYWQPLYHFARRQGLSREDAEDATQEFLSDIVLGKFLGQADPVKGKFRGFLLTAWKRFLIDQSRRQATERRGGRSVTVSLDVGTGELRWQELKSREQSPDRLFMASWAASLLDDVRQRLRNSYTERGRQGIFERLVPHLTDQLSAAEYETLARDMSLSPSAVKVALHRLRQRFGQTLREVVAETVDNPAEVDDEIRELLSTLTGNRS
jgi:RNA polymerase sigma factor (sigma-70 family)